MKDLKVVVAEWHDAYRRELKTRLIRNGYSINGESDNAQTTLKLIKERKPDIVIINSKLDTGNGMEICKIVTEDSICAAILIVDHLNHSLIETAKAIKINGILIKPLEDDVLVSTIEMGYSYYQRMVLLEHDIMCLEDKLETRKIIERAKGILMHNLGICETEAFKLIQKKSMDNRTSMKSIAQAVVLTNEIKN